MSATVEVELQPFNVPNYVLVKPKLAKRQDGYHWDTPKYHVSELSSETLNKLCDDFRAAVLKKAKTEVPDAS